MPLLETLELQPLRIAFTRAFRHASAERSETAAIWATALVDSGRAGYGESCPREYVTGESVESARTFGIAVTPRLRASVTSVASLRSWMDGHGQEVDQHPAAWCAIELALLDAFAKDAKLSIERLLSLPDLHGDFTYTAVVGDAAPEVIRAAVDEYRRFGFSMFKLKLSGKLDRDRAKLAIVHSSGVPPDRVRLDANNLWSDASEAVGFLSSLEYPVGGVEEPLRPNDYEGMAHIADALSCRMILDESVLRIEQLDGLPPPANRWIVNIRVSKMGGLMRSLAVAERARALGLGIIVGAQVGETSLLTRAALPVARAAGSALIAQEGAFGTRLLAHDVCDPPLMFAEGGVLRVSAFTALREPGFGIV